jgi:hypothetical protein
MRFRLVRPWNRRLFQLHVRDAVVEVRLPSLERQIKKGEGIAWTWWDGMECTVLRPDWRSKSPRITFGGTVVCEGRFCGSGLWKAFREDKISLSRWQFGQQTFVFEGGSLFWKSCPRTFTLRHAGGARLAFFRVDRPRRWINADVCYTGVVRDGVPEGLLPIVFGIILAWAHTSSYISTGD